MRLGIWFRVCVWAGAVFARYPRPLARGRHTREGSWELYDVWESGLEFAFGLAYSKKPYETNCFLRSDPKKHYETNVLFFRSDSAKAYKTNCF